MKFVDLEKQYKAYKVEIDRAVQSVLDSAAFVNGAAIREFEDDLVSFLGSGEAIACSSGTDALLLALIANGVKPNDEIVVPSFTFAATATMVRMVGAKPVFADVSPDTFNLDPLKFEEVITEKTVGVIPVSLFGQCADMEAIGEIAKRNGLWVMEDGAQSFGAVCGGRLSCTLSPLATTSFFPAKPLGGFGDGGAVFSQDANLAQKLRSIRNHGQEGRYNHVRLGLNARMDTIQAAILKVKLRHFPDEMVRRDKVARTYSEQLSGIVETPFIAVGNTTSWAQYTIRCERRDELRKFLSERGSPTAVHYPVPLNDQPVFAGGERFSCPVSEVLARRVLSLPMHPFMEHQEILAIADAIKVFYVR